MNNGLVGVVAKRNRVTPGNAYQEGGGEAHDENFVSKSATLQVVIACRDALLSKHRWSRYLSDRAVDVLVRILCVIALVLAATYDEADFHVIKVGMVNSEFVLSITVFFLWIRKLTVLKVFPSTGSLVFMFGKMLLDCWTWTFIFIIGLVAFATSIHVLYHNHRAAVPVPIEDLDSDCVKMDSSMDSVARVALFLLQVTLGADPSFDCFHNTSAAAPGVFLMMSFMVFVIIILLNMLIAMMAETYAQKAEKSFANYALGFANLLEKRRQRYYTGSSPPLNVLKIPYQILRVLRSVLLTCSFGWRGAKGSPGGHQGVIKGSSSGAAPAAAALRAAESEGTRVEKAEVNDLINALRVEIIRSKKDHLQKTVARFCRAQEEADEGPTIDDIKDIFREELVILRNFLTGSDDHGHGAGADAGVVATNATNISENGALLKSIKELTSGTQAALVEMRSEMRASMAQLRSELGDVSSRLLKEPAGS